MVEKLTGYDTAEHLISSEDIAFFLTDAFETGDADYIAHALHVALRSKSAVDTLAKLGSLCEELSIERGDIMLKTFLALVKSLGLEVTVKLP